MRFRSYVTVLFLAVATASVQTVSAGSLKFSAKMPKHPSQLPVLKLTAQEAPVALLNKLLSSSLGETKLTPLADAPFLKENQIKVGDQMLGVVEDEHVKVWVDQRSGDAAIYPTLTSLRPLSGDVESLVARGKEIFSLSEFLARDDTQFVIDKPQILTGATLIRDDTGSTKLEKPTEKYLAYVMARRFVNEFPVDGPGSRALLAFGGDGAVEGLTRVWKTAKTTEMVKTTLSARQVKQRITSQLRLAIKTSDVVVDRIDLAYYDGNRNFLQPVYRFTARISHRNQTTEVRTDDDFVIGYVPFAKPLEPLPRLGTSKGPKPITPVSKPKLASIEPSSAQSLDPIVGRYVVRNDDAGWVNDANDFWNSLASSFTGSLFTNSQYYWAEPRLFTNEKDFFINAMNLALIEVHGDWWLYSTLQNCCDLVNINGDIPSPGYGPSANGKLADWIIHSCEVVPAPDDTANWPDPWWTIFGGVRNVVGYRTIMYISDGAGAPYGASLGAVAPVVSSWLSDVISLNAYSSHPTSAAHGGIVRPMGRPSTISMCGHDGDSVFSTSSLGRANCLTVWWFPD